MQLLLTLDIWLDEVLDLDGNDTDITMITFHGSCDCSLFRGKILPGAVDTQMEKSGEARTLSARYMLEGVDDRGQSCRLFIENNGAMSPDGRMTTEPRIVTDSRSLAWLEKASLTGEVKGVDEKHIQILIYDKD